MFEETDRAPVSPGFRETLACPGTSILKPETEEDRVLEFARSTVSGLSARPRRLECRYLYDSQGSALFDLITKQPEYYLTRTEAEILAARACCIREITGPVTIVELGSGSSAKTDHLLQAWLECDPSVRYIPVDVSESALLEACRSIGRMHTAVRVMGVNADYREAFPVIKDVSPSMVVFLGSSIGNFTHKESTRFLSDLSSCLRPGDFLLVGLDLVKDYDTIELAYNDAAGVTGEFTRNLFARMNRELGSSIDISRVEHIAYYEPSADQVEIFARFMTKQVIQVAPLNRSFIIEECEMIETEISRKFRLEEFIPYVRGLGFKTEEVFTDERGWFALLLLRRSESREWRI